MMMLELRVPSCPRLRAMTKPLTVVGLASIGMKKAGPKSSGKPYLKEER